MLRQSANPNLRSGRVLFWLATAVLVLFVGVLLYRFYISNRTLEDPRRLEELRTASLAAQSASAGAFDWPQWRGPNRDGISLETNLLTDWPKDGPKVLWEQPTGEGFSAPAVADGRVLLLVQDPQKPKDEAVICWDARSGKELWRFRYPARFDEDFGNGPRATASVDGDVVYTVGGTGMMHCLKVKPNSAKGEFVWRHNLLEEFAASNLRWGVSFSPLIVGDLVYTMPGGPNGNSLAAFEKTTGKLAWKNLDDKAGYSSPVHATIAGQEQIVFFTESGLVSVDASDGMLFWRFPWQTDYGCNVATPIVVNDYIFISSGYGKGCAVVKIDRQGDTFTANLVYSNKRMRNHFSSSVYWKEHVYGFNDGALTCLEFRTGTPRWKESGFDKGSLMIAGGDLIILGENGTLAIAAASPKAYTEKSSLPISTEKCWTMPVLANGLLYVRDQKKIRCLDLRKDTGKTPNPS